MSPCRLLRGGVDWNLRNILQHKRIKSPPSWRRGLKSELIRLDIPAAIVASFVEAWIEIRCWYSCFKEDWSPPSWRRGLKFAKKEQRKMVYGRLLRGGVDWNITHPSKSNESFRRLLRGGVDWNTYAIVARFKKKSPPSWRRGLKFCILLQAVSSLFVASFVEAWIEIRICSGVFLIPCRLLRGGVDWNSLPKLFFCPMRSPPSWRRGLK